MKFKIGDFVIVNKNKVKFKGVVTDISSFFDTFPLIKVEDYSIEDRYKTNNWFIEEDLYFDLEKIRQYRLKELGI
jgi:hypothetical protein